MSGFTSPRRTRWPDVVPPRRICFALPSLNGGGAERAAVQILNALDPAAWSRTMYLAKREGPYLADVAPAIRLAAGHGGSRRQQWAELRRFLATERPHVVMSFLSYFTVLSAARSLPRGPRVVFNQQTPMTAFLEDADYAWRFPVRRRIFTAATRAGFNAADLVVATSRGVADDLAERFGVRRERLSVVPNPVDLERLARRAAEPIEPDQAGSYGPATVIAAGRLADAKNYPLLIDAMALVRERVAARLVILGEGERGPALRRLAADRGVADAIEFAGFRENPWKYIARSAVFVLTSRYEGFGNVLIEAMACGVPVVATASAGTRDIVRHEVDGFLVETHSPAAVADAIVRVLSDPALRARLAHEARHGAARFSLDRVAAAYDEILQGLAA